ncbi:hypothetical protein HK097_005311, partial [Rhizophlyctis rosea]
MEARRALGTSALPRHRVAPPTDTPGHTAVIKDLNAKLTHLETLANELTITHGDVQSAVSSTNWSTTPSSFTVSPTHQPPQNATTLPSHQDDRPLSEMFNSLSRKLSRPSTSAPTSSDDSKPTLKSITTRLLTIQSAIRPTLTRINAAQKTLKRSSTLATLPAYHDPSYWGSHTSPSLADDDDLLDSYLQNERLSRLGSLSQQPGADIDYRRDWESDIGVEEVEDDVEMLQDKIDKLEALLEQQLSPEAPIVLPAPPEELAVEAAEQLDENGTRTVLVPLGDAWVTKEEYYAEKERITSQGEEGGRRGHEADGDRMLPLGAKFVDYKNDNDRYGQRDVYDERGRVEDRRYGSEDRDGSRSRSEDRPRSQSRHRQEQAISPGGQYGRAEAEPYNAAGSRGLDNQSNLQRSPSARLRGPRPMQPSPQRSMTNPDLSQQVPQSQQQNAYGRSGSSANLSQQNQQTPPSDRPAAPQRNYSLGQPSSAQGRQQGNAFGQQTTQHHTQHHQLANPRQSGADSVPPGLTPSQQREYLQHQENTRQQQQTGRQQPIEQRPLTVSSQGSAGSLPEQRMTSEQREYIQHQQNLRQQQQQGLGRPGASGSLPSQQGQAQVRPSAYDREYAQQQQNLRQQQQGALSQGVGRTNTSASVPQQQRVDQGRPSGYEREYAQHQENLRQQQGQQAGAGRTNTSGSAPGQQQSRPSAHER